MESDSSDYSMTNEKPLLWPKGEIIQFWDTPGGKPFDSGKKILWIPTDSTTETFLCLVCGKYPSIRSIRVTSGCSL